MRRTLIIVLSFAFLCAMAAEVSACYKHGNSKWALHYAGSHNSVTNDCTFQMTDCTDLVSQGPCGPGRYDIYVLALDTQGIAATRYGLCCDPPTGCFWFYNWTSCSDFEIATAGWPGCGEGNAQTWIDTKPAGHVTLGILDVYVYPGCGCCLEACDDPRKSYGEWCDDASPTPWCCQIPQSTYPGAFGALCFGIKGYNPCGVTSTEAASWGAVKALYK